MRIAPVLLLAIFLVVVVLPHGAPADSVAGRISGEQLFVVDSRTDERLEVTLMWERAATDLDVIVFVEDEFGDPVTLAAGISSSERLERVVSGTVAGIEVFIFVDVFRGPRTRFQLSVQGTFAEDIFSTARATSDARGGLHEIERDDPRFDGARALAARYRAIKDSTTRRR